MRTGTDETTTTIAEHDSGAIPWRVTWLGYSCGLLISLTLGHFLLGLPIQCSDSFGQLVKATGSWGDLLSGEFTQRAYMRPLMWGQIKLIYELSGGHYFAWYRGAHVLETVVLVLLFVRLVRPRTLTDLAPLALGLAVLFGLHTFQGTVREAFPLNHFMMVLIYCLLAANLVMAKYSWWNDVLAGLLFAISALTIESGLLVGAVLVGGVLVGGQGVSRIGAAVQILILIVYLILRFPVFEVGAPDLIERSSGFGFGILEPPELVARFGSNPYGFYLYNAVSGALSVLFSEPTGGVYGLTKQALEGDLDFETWDTFLASLCATGLIAAFVWRRRSAFAAWRFDRDDQLIALFFIVLAANAVVTYPYSKDVVMSPAGVFFAIAVSVAARSILSSLPTTASLRFEALALGAFALTGILWGIRLTEAHLNLRAGAVVERNEWAYMEEDRDFSQTERRLFRTLRNDALFTHPAPGPLSSPIRSWLSRE